MKKKYLIVSLLAAATACIFAGCAAKAATGAELDKLGNFGFENSAHENGYLDLKLDDGFKVDGVLDEGVWENNGTAWTFAHANSTEENPITMTSMSYLGEKGVYLALSVKDTAIYYSPDRRASGNTSVEVYIGAFDATEWNGDSSALRGADGVGFLHYGTAHLPHQERGARRQRLQAQRRMGAVV